MWQQNVRKEIAVVGVFDGKYKLLFSDLYAYALFEHDGECDPSRQYPMGAR